MLSFLTLASVLQYLFDRFHRFAEEVHVEFLKFGPSESLRKVITRLEAFDLELGAGTE
jgi:hypothetical protein